MAESGAPWGSSRHYFPGGKEQLGVEAVAAAAKLVADMIERCFPPQGDSARGIRKLFSKTAAQLERSGFGAGCPIATVALEMTPRSPAMTEACQAALALWHETLKAGLVRTGVNEAQAGEGARTILTMFEGGLVFARVHQSSLPMTRSAEDAIRLLKGEDLRLPSARCPQ